MRIRWRMLLQRLLLVLSGLWAGVELQYRIRFAPDAYDFAFFMDGARAIAAGQPLYPEGSGYLNGPSLAFALRPLVFADHRLVAQLWVAGSVLLLPVIAWLGLRIARVSVRWQDVAVVTMLLALAVPVRHTVALGQLTVLATAVAMGAWLASGSGGVAMPMLAGVLLWFAFELKPHYIWFLVVLLLWQRRWHTLLAAAGAAVAMNVLLWLVYPSAMWGHWLRLVFASRGSITAQSEQSTLGAAAVRFLGVDPGVSVAVTFVVSVVVWAVTYRRVRRADAPTYTAVLVMAALPFVTPFSHPQDWVISAIAMLVALAAAGPGRSAPWLALVFALWVLPDSRNLYVTSTVMSIMGVVAVVAIVSAWGRFRWSALAALGWLAVLDLLTSEPAMLSGRMQPIAAVIGFFTWAALAADGSFIAPSARTKGRRSQLVVARHDVWRRWELGCQGRD